MLSNLGTQGCYTFLPGFLRTSQAQVPMSDEKIVSLNCFDRHGVEHTVKVRAESVL
jgi:hypothetical protein